MIKSLCLWFAFLSIYRSSSFEYRNIKDLFSETSVCPIMAVSREHVTNAVHGALQASRQQQLKQVQLPPHVYDLARIFTTSVPLNDQQKKLVRFVGLPMLYSLLSDKVGNKEVDEGEQEFNSLKEACEAVLRYPMNLLLAPNRPEFRRISVSVTGIVCVCVETG